MRRVGCAIIAFVMCAMLLVGCGSSRTPEEFLPLDDFRNIPGITAEEIASIERIKDSRAQLIYGMNFSVETFETSTGETKGFTALLTQELAALFGIPFEIKICDWDELIEGVNDKSIDFTGELTATPERLQTYFMTQPIAQRAMKIFTNDHAAPIAEIRQDRKLRYAFLEGTTAQEIIMKAEGDTFESFFAQNDKEILTMLETKQVDAFFQEGPSEAAFMEYDFVTVQQFFPLAYAPVSMTTANTDLSALVSVVDKYINSGYSKRLFNLYLKGDEQFRQHKTMSRMTPEERAYIAAHLAQNEPIPVILESDNYPNAFWNTQDKQFQGAAVEVLAQISLLTGLRFEPINKTDSTWYENMQALRNGEAALISELLVSKDREGQSIWAADPYSEDFYALLSLQEAPEIDVIQIPYYRVGVQNGSAAEDIYKEWFPSYDNLTSFPTNMDAFAAMERGEIDFVMASRNTLLSVTNYSEKPGYKSNLVFNYVCNSYFGFNRNEALLCSIISKTQKVIEVDEIADRWIRKTYDYSKAQLPYLIGFTVLVTLGLIGVAILLVLNRRLRRNLEVIVLQRTHELAIQTEAAQIASRAKSDFLARMSHEIRTPLNAIMGMTEIIKRSSADTAKVDYSAHEISQASAHLLDILNDVLDMSKIESGKFELAHETFELNDAISDVDSMLLQRCAEKRIAFQREYSKLAGDYVVGDKLRLKQILINLLGNAVKFTPNGGRIDFIVQEVARSTDTLTLDFTIADNGIGISQEQLTRLFTPFEQADTSIAARFGGTGLGLAISQNLLKQMNSSISVKSALGEGSAFSFRLALPLAQAVDVHAAQETTTMPDLTGKRILLVEDIEINRVILKGLLAETHVILEEAENGQVAFEKFAASEPNHYDLLFMDIQMPIMDGYEAVKRIRALARPDAATVPIIAMTANAYKEDIAQAQSVGMNAHLAKPLDLTILARILHQYFPAL